MISTPSAASGLRSPVRTAGMARDAVALLIIVLAYIATALFPVGSKATADIALTIACGFVLGVAIVFVAARLHVSRARQFVIWFALVFLNLASVAVEGTLFAPAESPPALLAANVLRLAIGSAFIAGAIAVVFGTSNTAAARRMGGWWWRLLLAAVGYFVLYLVLGGINYSLVTHPYYESHAGSLTVPAAQAIFLYEPIRGLVMVVSVLPLIVLRTERKLVVAVVAGSLLFIAGGVVPLLPESSLPLYLRVASLWEILGQNFLTGIVATYLFSADLRA